VDRQQHHRYDQPGVCRRECGGPGQPGKHERQQGRQDDCDLRLTGFGPGRCRGCDLRGNDLSALTGAPHLKHVIVDRAETIQLGEALAAELDVTFGDDVPGHL
jgi:hypothetical protein